MAPQNVFRSVVALSLLLSINTVASGLLPGNIPEDWKTLLEWSGNGGVSEYVVNHLPISTLPRVALLALGVGFVAFMVSVQLGMFLFWRFARTGYLVLTGAFVIYTAFDGILVTVPVQEALYQLTLLLDGAVITMSYLSPISAYFERRNV
jgi:hypothetical protein